MLSLVKNLVSKSLNMVSLFVGCGVVLGHLYIAPSLAMDLPEEKTKNGTITLRVVGERADPISTAVTKVVNQKHYIKTIVHGQNAPQYLQVEFSPEQIKNLNTLVASFIREIHVNHPTYPITIDNIKLVMNYLQREAIERYPNVAPRKPFLLLLRDTQPYPLVIQSAGKHFFCDQKSDLDKYALPPEHSWYPFPNEVSNNIRRLTCSLLTNKELATIAQLSEHWRREAYSHLYKQIYGEIDHMLEKRKPYIFCIPSNYFRVINPYYGTGYKGVADSYTTDFKAVTNPDGTGHKYFSLAQGQREALNWLVVSCCHEINKIEHARNKSSSFVSYRRENNHPLKWVLFEPPTEKIVSLCLQYAFETNSMIGDRENWDLNERGYLEGEPLLLSISRDFETPHERMQKTINYVCKNW